MTNKSLKLIINIVLTILLFIPVYIGVYKYFDLQKNQKSRDAEQVFAQNSKSQVENSPFIKSLPFSNQNFSVFYSTVKDEVQVVMKNKGLSFQETKMKNQLQVTNFLQNIGVPLETQKIIWLMEQ